jgi:hypothetical protein
MDDDAGVKAVVSVRSAVSPYVHTHTSRLSISWCNEVGIVGSGAILSIEDDDIISLTACTVVVGLEIARSFIEAEGL